MKLKYYLIDYSIGAKGERKQSNMSCSTDSRYRPHEKFLLEQSIVSNVVLAEQKGQIYRMKYARTFMSIDLTGCLRPPTLLPIL